MNAPGERDRLETGDDLTVTRRPDVKALARAVRLRLELLGALDDIYRAERALEEGNQRDVAKSLRGARNALLGNGVNRWPMRARIDGEVESHALISPKTHRFLGMWRPPVAPASPQELGCSAIVCECLEQLADGGQIRQHWETGCFDMPEYETVPALSENWEDLLKQMDSKKDL